MFSNYRTSEPQALACISNGAAPQTQLQRSATSLDYVNVASASSAHSVVSSLSNLLAPTLEMLAGMQATHSSGKSGRSKKKGKITARFFNPVGPRPWLKFSTPMQTLSATLTHSDTLFITSTTVPIGASLIVTLNTFAGISEYTDLFDQYRIDRCEVLIEPRAAQGTTQFGRVSSAVDLDDGNVPTVARQVEMRQLSLSGSDGSGRYHTWQPHMAVALFAGAFTSYGNEPADWIDSASPAVQHYGLKTWADPTPTAVIYAYTLRCHVTFRGPGI